MGSSGVPILHEATEKDVVGHDVLPWHCTEQGEGGLKLTKFGVHVGEVVGSEAVVGGTGGDHEGVDLLATDHALASPSPSLAGVGRRAGLIIVEIGWREVGDVAKEEAIDVTEGGVDKPNSGSAARKVQPFHTGNIDDCPPLSLPLLLSLLLSEVDSGGAVGSRRLRSRLESDLANGARMKVDSRVVKQMKSSPPPPSLLVLRWAGYGVSPPLPPPLVAEGAAVAGVA